MGTGAIGRSVGQGRSVFLIRQVVTSCAKVGALCPLRSTGHRVSMKMFLVASFPRWPSAPSPFQAA
jgi:hypothetical protein